MKIRNGFVSNSSSTSFTCDICHITEHGYDLDLDDAEMLQCSEEHIFHRKHIKRCYELLSDSIRYVIQTTKLTSKNNLDLTKLGLNNEDYEFNKFHIEDVYYEFGADFRKAVSEIICPICKLELVTEHDEAKYYQKRFNLNTIEEIRKQFKSYKEFKAWLP